MSLGPEPGVLVGERGPCRGSSSPGPTTGPEERVAGRVRLALQRRRHRPHEPAAGLVALAPTRSEATITQAAPSSAGHAIIAVSGSATIRDASTSSTVTRVVGLAVAPRAEGAVVPVLGGDGGEVLGRGAVVVHAPLRPQREVGRGQDGRVELVAPGAPARRRRRGHLGHLVEADGHGHLGPPGRHRPRRLAERHEPVADAFSTWVTGSPVRPSSFIAFTPSIDAGWM